jgi:Mor family transcriptional regulator
VVKLGKPARLMDESSIISEYESGVMVQDILEKYDLSRSFFNEILKRNGVAIRKRIGYNVPKKISDEQLLLLADRYDKGESLRSLAKEYGVSLSGISKRLKNIGRRSVVMAPRAYRYNFFENIDSEEKAYILGLYAADGYVRDKLNIVGIDLKDGVSEKDLLDKINTILGNPSEIKKYDGMLRLSFKCAKMRRDLNKLGIVQNKSLIFVPPPIRKDLRVHFARGLVDGDGCIFSTQRISHSGVNIYEVISLSLVGSKGTVEWMRDFVRELIGCTTQDAFPHKSVWRVQFEGDIGARVMGKLYDGCAIALHRKLVLARDKMVIEVENGVQRVGQIIAKEFYAKYHYLKTLPVGCLSFGWWKDGVLVGVASVGEPSFPNAWMMLYGVAGVKKKVLELRRFSLNEFAVKNDASMFLSEIIKLLRVERKDVDCMLSYADSEEGHIGIMYQAIGAKYVGVSRQLVITEGGIRKPVSRRWNVMNSIEGGAKIESGKHRYIIILRKGDEEKHRIERELLERLEFLEYPKLTN